MKEKSLCRLFGALAVAALAALGALRATAALELVTNGGFEGGPNNLNWPYYCVPNSWSGVNGGLQRDGGPWSYTIYAGSYSAFLQGGGAWVGQTLDFPVAGTYRISFAYTRRRDETVYTTVPTVQVWL